MKTQKTVAGFLLITAPILFMGAFTLLQINFAYPDILRQPVDTVLTQFAAGGSGLVANWYAMLFSAILFVPIVVLLHPFLAREDKWYLPLASVFGVLAGVVQMVGFVRWPFLVPVLAKAYLDPAASQATQQSVSVVFSAFNQYAGVGIGEHLGYIFTGLWSLLIGLAMLDSPIFPKWLGWIGILSGLGILPGALESAGFAWAGTVNALAYILWALWLLVSGIYMLRWGSRS